MLRQVLRSLAVLAALCMFAQPGLAQTSEAPIQVMILGTYPFSTPGLESTRDLATEIMSPQRQAEIAEVVDALAEFQPTRVAIEVEPERSDRIDREYDEFVEEGAPLAPDEVQQIGFRVAQRMGLDELDAVDHPGEFLFAEVMSYAQRFEPGVMIQVLQTTAAQNAERDEIRSNQSIGALLRHVNEPDEIGRTHRLYVSMAKLGAGGDYQGADFLSSWYQRNIHIFANLQALAEPGDRVLLMIGSAHAAILRELVQNDPRMQLVEPTEFLPS